MTPIYPANARGKSCSRRLYAWQKTSSGWVLLVLRQFIYPQARVVRLLNRIVAALTDPDRGEFVLVLPPRINRKNLILLVLIKAQMSVILNRAILLFNPPRSALPFLRLRRS